MFARSIRSGETDFDVAVIHTPFALSMSKGERRVFQHPVKGLRIAKSSDLSRPSALGSELAANGSQLLIA